MKKLLLFIIISTMFGSDMLAQNWTAVSPPQMSTATGLTIHNNALFACTQAVSPHRSTDGSTWVQKNNGLSGYGPQGGGIGTCGTWIYYGSKENIHRSNDDGNTWDTAGVGITVTATNYGRFFYEFGGVYFCSMSAAVTNGGGLYRSTDGTTWSLCTLGSSPGEAAYQMTQIGNKIYVGTNMSFYESSDNGLTWTSVSTNGAKVYNGLKEYKGRWLIHTTFGMEYSDDAGTTWDTLTSSIKSSTYCGFVEGAGDTLYSYSASGGVHYSVDTGNTWVSIRANLTSLEVNVMQGMQYFQGKLYLATVLAVKSFGNGGGGSSVENLNSLADQISTYPNPFNELVTIENKSTTTIQVSLFDITGKEIVRERTNRSKYQLTTTDLPAGVYFVKIKDVATGQMIKTQKLIKQ